MLFRSKVSKISIMNCNSFKIFVFFDCDFLEEFVIEPFQQLKFCFCNRRFIKLLKSKNGFTEKTTFIGLSDPFLKDVSVDSQFDNPRVKFFSSGKNKFLVKKVDDFPSLYDLAFLFSDENVPIEILPRTILSHISNVSYKNQNIIYSLSECFRDNHAQFRDLLVRCCVCDGGKNRGEKLCKKIEVKKKYNPIEEEVNEVRELLDRMAW